jgi:AcrR family transcriptional regulator
MPNTSSTALKPRKKPVQERASVTVQAISEATIQVLLKEGAKSLTTTRVAERAGVSVGTLYQYYPNKRSLLYAVLEQHLQQVSRIVSETCESLHGYPINKMIGGVIDAYIDTKMKRPDVSLALYKVSEELNAAAPIANVFRRTEAAVSEMLATLPGDNSDKIAFVTLILFSTMAGAAKAVLGKGATPTLVRELKRALKILCINYIETELAG